MRPGGGGAGWLDRLLGLAAAPWVCRMLIVSLVVLYAAWIGYEIARDRLYDFNLYYIAASGFQSGVDVYGLARDCQGASASGWAELAARHGMEYYAPPYRYPPLTAQLVLPLTLLGPRVAGAVWLVLTGLAFLASAWLLGKASGFPYGVPLALVLLLVLVPPLATMHAGQVNGLMLLAVCVGIYGLARKNSVTAGAGLAVGMMLKLIPLALVLYLPWRRLWKAGAAAVAVAIILVLTAPLTLGAGIVQSYADNFFVMGQPGTIFTTGPNQSLSGFWARALAGSVEPDAIYMVYLASAAVVVAATVAVLWPPARLGRRWQAEMALIVCALQLIMPYSWYHQLVLLLIPLFVVVHAILEGDAPRWWLAPVVIGVAATDVHGLFWHDISAPALLSMPMYVTLMLWLMLSWLIAGPKLRKLGNG